ncbi:MAG: hypothetical protein LBP80_09530 [Treponema sp.]|jgi:predicted AAA+ superfamily ATPase|nr:hypothetical protein [Treponema sp.]
MAEMTAQEAAEWGKTLNFEKVWAMFAESGQRQTETEKLLIQLEKNIDRVSNEISQLGKNIDRVSNNVGGLNRSMGELVETLIAARLWEKFPDYGLTRAYQRIPIYDKNNQIKTDIDILLVNTDICMAVEVKHELNRMDEVDRHIKRMQLIRQYPPPYITPDKQLLGAMAGGVVDPDVKDYAYKSGFFVLELTGESVHLVPPPDGFVPQKW